MTKGFSVHRYHLVPTLAVLALAACGKEPAEPKTADEVIAEAGELEQPEPGQYQTKVELLAFEVPGLPPEQAEKMKSMMGNVGGQQASYCLTEEDAKKGFEESVRKMSQGQGGLDCKFAEFDVDGGRLAAEMTCATAQGVTSTMTLDGSATSNSTSMTMDIKQKAAMIPGGEMRMKMKMDSKRTGDCA